jgi:hypothetical protein
MDDLPVTSLMDTKQSSAWSIPDDTQSSVDILTIPAGLNDVPEWIHTPLHRFLRLKQRNWSAKNTRQRTRNHFNRMKLMISFFIEHYEWSEWQQLSVRWVKDYIDHNCGRGKQPIRLQCTKKGREGKTE